MLAKTMVVSAQVVRSELGVEWEPHKVLVTDMLVEWEQLVALEE